VLRQCCASVSFCAFCVMAGRNRPSLLVLVPDRRAAHHPRARTPAAPLRNTAPHLAAR
jgi:hypothetical protein